MSVPWARRLSKTSENTVVYNLLRDISNRLGDRYRVPITIISPTTKQEIFLGFDALIQGLPPGRLTVFQFKRPFTSGVTCCVKFRVFRYQHCTLLRLFGPGVASYAFCPVPFTRDFIARRGSILDETYFPDVNDIPSWTGKRIDSRTVRYPEPNGSPHPHRGRQWSPGMTDPGRYDKLPESCTRKWEKLQDMIFETGVKTGAKTSYMKERLGKESEEPLEPGGVGRVHYVFIPAESSKHPKVSNLDSTP